MADLKLKVVELEFPKTEDYVYGEIKDWGFFTKLIEEKALLKKGRFFAIVPEDIDYQFLYDFKTGGKIFPNNNEIHTFSGFSMQEITNYAQKVFIDVSTIFLNDEDNYLLMEDYYAKSSDSWLAKAKINYSVIGNIVFYLLDKNKIPDLKEYYKVASGFPFMPLFIQCKNRDLFFNIEKADEVLNGLRMFFFEVYDKESFLVWVSDDNEKLLSCLNTVINL